MLNSLSLSYEEYGDSQAPALIILHELSFAVRK